MNPSAQYQSDLKQPDFIADPAQAQVIDYLQQLYDELITEQQAFSFVSRLLPERHKKSSGLYLYGTVGSGKTYLMDLFFNSLPFSNKYRIHYHAFMQSIHAQLHQLTGQKNPLKQIARQLAAKACIICLDEFLVQDVTDAMTLANLFAALSQKGIRLVITTNTAPDDLYKNGVQRQYFLPAIDFIKNELRVMLLQPNCDYRLRTLEQASIFYTPIDAQSDAALAARFNALTAHTTTQQGLLSLNSRSILTLGYSSDILWCDFHVLCVEPRSNYDYIELARIYHTLFLRAIPKMSDMHKDWVKRFIHLIDTLYDHRVKLIVSAQTTIDLLYQGDYLQAEMARTKSRLIEMQSLDYLTTAHNVT